MVSEHYIHTEFSPGVHSLCLDTDGESQHSVQLTNCHFVMGYEMVQNTPDTSVWGWEDLWGYPCTSGAKQIWGIPDVTTYLYVGNWVQHCHCFMYTEELKNIYFKLKSTVSKYFYSKWCIESLVGFVWCQWQAENLIEANSFSCPFSHLPVFAALPDFILTCLFLAQQMKTSLETNEKGVKCMC